MNKNRLRDVFTPSSPAKITFVERDNINDRLVRSLELPGTQIVIYGHTGSGKSTLLENVLFRVYDKQINTNCMKGMSFEEVILDAFDQLDSYYTSESTKSKKKGGDIKLITDYLFIKSQIGVVYENNLGEKESRLLPPQLTPQSLGRLLGASGYCWVLEDFHKIEGVEKQKLTQMMKVFSNLSSLYQDLKVIALGAVNTAREVVEYDPEMRKRVSEIHVDLMTDDEIKQIIIKGCDALNIIVNEDLQNDIAEYSNGLAAICHKLCYLMCSSALITETISEPIEFEPTDLQKALSDYIKDEEDTIKTAFDRTLKITSVDNLFRIMCSFNQSGAHIDDMFEKAKFNSVNITKKKIIEDSHKLLTDEYGKTFKYDENSHRYSFTDPFYRVFAKAYLENKDNSLSRKKMTNEEVIQMINIAFSKVKLQFSESDVIVDVSIASGALKSMKSG